MLWIKNVLGISNTNGNVEVHSFSHALGVPCSPGPLRALHTHSASLTLQFHEALLLYEDTEIQKVKRWHQANDTCCHPSREEPHCMVRCKYHSNACHQGLHPGCGCCSCQEDMTHPGTSGNNVLLYGKGTEQD